MFAQRDDGLEKTRLEKLHSNVLSCLNIREAQKDTEAGGGGNWEPMRKPKGRIRCLTAIMSSFNVACDMTFSATSHVNCL